MIEWVENTILILIVVFLGMCGLVFLMSFYVIMLVFWATLFAINMIATIFYADKTIPRKEDNLK